MLSSLNRLANRGAIQAAKCLQFPKNSVSITNFPIKQYNFSIQTCAFSTYEGIRLNNIGPVEGAFRAHKRVGRGRGSGVGKTSRRGQKGNKARNGLLKLVRYEGGQTPLWRRTPKRGFKNINRRELETLNITKLISFILQGRIDAKKVITMKDLYESKIVGNIKHGVKLLSIGADLVSRLPLPIRIELTHASATAKEAIEKAGGSVKFIYHSPRHLRFIKNPKNFKWIPKPSVPPPKLSLRYELQTCGKEGYQKLLETRMSRIKRRLRKSQV